MLTIQPHQSLISKIRQRRINSVKSQISRKQQESRRDFYRQYQPYASIFDYEQAADMIDVFMRRKPAHCSSRKYLKQLSEIKKSDFSYSKISKILNSDNPSSKTEGCKYSKPDYYEQIRDRYYSQETFINPEANDAAEFNFKKIKLDTKLNQSIFCRNTLSKDDILNILEESKGLTLNSGSLLRKSYDKDTIYDLPLRFATACYNSRDLGNGYIQDKVPKIFKGIPAEELLCSLDKFSVQFRNTDMKTDNPDGYINVKIAGKTFYFKPLLSGEECRTFVISQDKGKDKNSVIYKLFYDDNRIKHYNRCISPSGITFAPAGLYGNIGILREANRAGVANVPELYISNPIFYPVEFYGDKYLGGWAVIENANNKKVKDGLDFEKWLDSMGLMLNDKKENSWVNNICVDLGFVANSKREYDFKTGWGDEIVNQVYSRYINYETTQDIIDYLSKSKINYTDGNDNLY